MHVPRLHRQAFRRCSSLVSVALPAALVSIGHAAFEGCSSLTSITPLPDGVSIGDCAFVDCPLDDEARSAVLAVNFWAVTRPPTDAQGHAIVPEGLTTIGSWAFSDTCSTLSLGRDFNTTLLSVDFPSSLVSVGDYAFHCCTALTSVALPAGVTSIGDCTFAYCSALTSIHLPASVTSICGTAFSDCAALASIHLPAGVIFADDWLE